MGSTNITAGEAATLTWSSTNAASCEASGARAGVRSVNGIERSMELSTDSTFTMQCTGSGGTATDTVTVTVTPPPLEPMVQFTAPDFVDEGATATLAWESTSTTDCVASGGWTGAKALSGSEDVGPVNSTTTFSLTCFGNNQSVADTREVKVYSATDDTDIDGLLGPWEIGHFGSLAQDAVGDPDRDGANNGSEQSMMTDPLDADSDDDDLIDGQEMLHSTDPLKADTDGDGISDFDEVLAATNPNDNSSGCRSSSGAAGLFSLLALTLVAHRRRYNH